MAEQFDPYRIWLGIPSYEQPPDHYRLLGIPQYSSDYDMIENAADRQMAHLRTFQVGKHSDLSQKLLNEVAAARVCLFNEQQKADYDQKLRTQMMPPEAVASVSVPPAQEQPPGSSPELHQELDHFNAITISNSASSARKHVRKRKKALTKHSVVSIVGMIVFGVIGIFAGCFVLFLINPHHPLIENMASSAHGTDEAQQRSTPPSRPSSPQQQENRRHSPQPSRQTNVRMKPLRPKVEPIPFESAPSSKAVDSRPPRDPAKIHETPKVTAPPSPVESKQIVVLDFSRSVMYTKLAENVNLEKTAVRLEEVVGLGTPYKMQPGHGIVSRGHPVNIVLTDYPGISIHLALRARNGVTLNAVPQMDTGQGKKVKFTPKRVKQFCVDVVRDTNKLSRQLSAARTQAQSIKGWLASPSIKPMKLYGIKKQQLGILEGQTIPALQKQAAYMQTRVVFMQKLSQLVKQIHGNVKITATITPSST